MSTTRSRRPRVPRGRVVVAMAAASFVAGILVTWPLRLFLGAALLSGRAGSPPTIVAVPALLGVVLLVLASTWVWHRWFPGAWTMGLGLLLLGVWLGVALQ